MRKTLSILPLALLGALLLFSCQSPVKTVEDVPTTVTVIVQDNRGLPMHSIPVDAYKGLTSDAEHLLQSRVTEANGTTGFVLNIPSNGGNYNFVAGNDQTGRVIRTAALLCRDTTILITLQGASIECNGALIDTILFTDACANTAGQDFTSTAERRYTSECDEAMTVTFSDLNLDNLRLIATVFDNDGNEVQGTSFVLPPGGSFSVRMDYTPQAVGLLDAVMQFNAQGAVSQWDVTLSIIGYAVDCNDCDCSDETILIDMGSVVVDGDSAVIITREINTNRSICDRNDIISKPFSRHPIFRLDNTPFPTVAPGNAQLVRIIFDPSNVGPVTDSLVFETTYPSNGVKCRFTVIVTGQGVRAQCCVDEAASEGLVVDHSVNPPVYRIRLNTALQESAAGKICFYNCGSGGWLQISRPAVTTATGFTIPAQNYSLRARTEGGGTGCFDVSFLPTERMVWPNGRNSGPGITTFTTQFTVFGCEPSTVQVIATVDTTPTLFSICVFRWDQNRQNGYNFTPASLRGSFIEDPNAESSASAMFTDIAYLSGPGGVLTGRVRIRSGWKLVRTGVSDQDDFTYDEIRNWPEFGSLTQGIDTGTPFFDMVLHGVYVIQIERGGQFFFALVRVREISDDGQKQKICFDVIFPV